MKTYYFLCVISLSCAQIFAQGDQNLGPYGISDNYKYDSSGPATQIISKLHKEECTYQIIRSAGDDYLRFEMIPDSNSLLVTTIATFNSTIRLDSQSDNNVKIVDVVRQQNDMAFLVATTSGYQYFVARASNAISVPPGFFMLEAKGLNSTDWKVVKMLTMSTRFGYDFGDLGHRFSIQSIKLVGLNTIKVFPVKSEDWVDFTVNENSITVGENTIPDSSMINPTYISEANLIKAFSQNIADSNDEVRRKVEYAKGGKDYILSILPGFNDQQAANNIKSRIESVYTATP